MIKLKKVVWTRCLRKGWNLEMSKLSRIKSSILEEEWQDEIVEKSVGVIYGVMSMVDVCLDARKGS